MLEIRNGPCCSESFLSRGSERGNLETPKSGLMSTSCTFLEESRRAEEQLGTVQGSPGATCTQR